MVLFKEVWEIYPGDKHKEIYIHEFHTKLKGDVDGAGKYRQG